MKPDHFFSATQQDRLRQLMHVWKFSPEQPVPEEWMMMLDTELKATIERSKELLAQQS